MAVTPINSEGRSVQVPVAEHLEEALGWESVYAWNEETFGPDGTLGRADTKQAVLIRDLRAALERLNSDLPTSAIDDAVRDLTVYDVSRSMVQHNHDFYRLLRNGVPVEYRDAQGRPKSARARVIDFENAPGSNRFLAVRELKLTGMRTPNYNRRADLVCFVNGLPLVFIELKAVYRNIREGFDNNLSDYMDENVIAHAFHHNAFLVVSNGDRARYGSITSEWGHFAEWKRLEEADKGSLEAQVLLNGMLAHNRLLDIVENFILFDQSKPGATRKVIARNHQVLGVNRAVASVSRQQALKREFPAGQRLRRRVVELPLESRAPADYVRAPGRAAEVEPPYIPRGPVDIIERAHPDIGRLGVFWHTQGSGKSYSMAFFAEKVRRKLEGNFTFLLMTDRNDLDGQIYGTFVGCGIADNQTPRAASGDDLEKLLKENHRYLFSLIHKFNKNVDPKQPYSRRDDIIVISDEAHRTQAGRLARNMRLALPNAAFIGFTGTPLFEQDELTRRIFGHYVSRYDFKRSEEDGATVKLVYENRGEKLGVARIDLNDRIAAKIEEAELDPDREALLEKLLGKNYEVITADERLEKIADDFVEHCATRWESGKSMLVCIDKITCARMLQLIGPRWQAKTKSVRAATEVKLAQAQAESNQTRRAALEEEAKHLAAQADWLDETIVEIIISEAQNEVKDFAKWGFDITPHRRPDEAGLPDGRREADGCGIRLQKPGSSLPSRHRLRHVADRFRRRVPFNSLRRQTDEGAYADAGDRAGKPGVSRQGLRPHRRLQRHAEKPAGGAGAVCARRRRRRRRGDRRTGGGACAGPDGGHRGGRGASAQAGLRSGNARRLYRFRAHQGAEGCGGSRLFQRQGQAPIRDPGPPGVRPLQGIADGAFGFCLCRAARQSRGDLQEADGAARHCGRDRTPEGAAPDRQRSDPHTGAGR